jgi:hypothetical protein
LCAGRKDWSEIRSIEESCSSDARKQSLELVCLCMALTNSY